MHTSIISVAALAPHLQDPNWLVFDCRHDLADHSAGRRLYEQSHIQGALFFDMEHDAAGIKTGTNGRHPLPDKAAFAQRMGALGVGPHMQVVAYDQVGGQFAARLWWMLRWIGHEAVALLDGGWPIWQQLQLPISHQVESRPAQSLSLRTDLTRTVLVDEVMQVSATPHSARMIVDARAPERYAGQIEPIDPVAGHIPGAHNRFYKDNLNADLSFKPLGQLRTEWSGILGSRTPADLIVHCGSGVTACHHLVVLHALGREGAALYPGSWSEWVADSARPVATGQSPR